MLSEENILDIVKQLQPHQEQSSIPDSSRTFSVHDKIFLIIQQGTDPLKIDVRCDRKLSKLLQARYETVMSSRLLGNNGIEVILTGQLPADEVRDLIIHSYHITSVIQ